MTEQPDFSKMSPQEIAEYQKKNCIFCKIIAGEIPSKKVYEDKEFYAILDINPVTKGHVLLMPKEHVQVMPQMQPLLVGNLAEAIHNVSEKILKSLDCKGTSVFIANGAVAGQKAPHFIIHIIPRKDGDEVPLNPEFKELPKNEWEEMHKKIYKAIYGQEPGENNQEESNEETEENVEEDTNEKQEDEDTSEDEEEPEQEDELKEDSEEDEPEEKNEDDNEDSEDESDEEDDKPDLDKIAGLFK